jgi:hypothetical protein
VKAPRIAAGIERADREAERVPVVIFFAIVTSSSRLAGTFGLPSAPVRPASFITFALR